MTVDSRLIQFVRLMPALDNGAKWSGAPDRLGLLLSRRAASAGAGVASNGMGYSKGFANGSILARASTRPLLS